MLNLEDVEREIDELVPEDQRAAVVNVVQRLLISQTWLVVDLIQQQPEGITKQQLREMVMERVKQLI